MKKINKILSKTFIITGVLKITTLILFAAIMFTSVTAVPLNIIKWIVKILQVLLCIISPIMIINNIANKNLSWIGYIISYLSIIAEYFIPSSTLFILAKNILSGYIYYVSGKIIKKSLTKEDNLRSINKTIKTINIIYIVLIFIAILSTTIRNIYIDVQKPKEKIESLKNINEPIQTEYQNNKTLKKGNKTINIDMLYKYEITGRVTNIEKYNNNEIFSKISPLDVGISWGETANKYNHNKIKYSSIGDRKIYSSYDYDAVYNSFETSNNHLIPKNDKIKKYLSLIKRNDYIRIEGYLVNVSTNNWYTKSSTTRNDTGDGACEIIYVTNIIWLEEN